MKILHIITGLQNGGAEGALYRLCKAGSSHKHYVISLTGPGKYGELLQGLDVNLFCANLKFGPKILLGLIRVFLVIRKISPDVVQTWMYHADLIGGCISRLAGVKKVVWGVRHSDFSRDQSKAFTMLLARTCALVSGFVPHKIVYCALEAREAHQKLGYEAGKDVVIPNGYFFEDFDVIEEEVQRFRSPFALSGHVLIGMVARYNPQKDHATLIKAIGRLKRKGYRFRLLLIGDAVDRRNEFLCRQLRTEGVSMDVELLGPRNDISVVMNSLDIHVLSSSFGEGFPNVVAESMACGTPNIVTDVGDASLIVGNAGWIIPSKDHMALSQAIEEVITIKNTDAAKWQALQVASRARIRRKFSIQSTVQQYEAVWSTK